MHDILIEKLKRPTPRYTSYPTAPHFRGDFDDATYRAWLKALPRGSSVSLYVHIPFCDRLCWFCGCTTKQTRQYKPIERYLQSLYKEISTVGGLMGELTEVTALHLGGGSPTMLEPADFAALRSAIDMHFDVSPNAEISIEMDPNDLNEEKYDAMAEFGVTRASLGVQDFDPKVQAAINRPQTFRQTRTVVEVMRARGVASVNLDMLYGLPHQSLATIDDTVAKVRSLKPDRVALFGYAHVPWMKKHQTMIDESVLPDVGERFAQASRAAELLTENGYRRIGMDHFARRHDALSRAESDGSLSRNFQGYTTDDADALIGLGASSIGRLPQGYVQNTPSTHDYQRRVDAEGGLATVRGLELSQDDTMRGWLIERLMCDFGFSGDELRSRFGQPAETVLEEADALVKSDGHDLFVKDAGAYRVTETGRPYVRTIAAEFDRYLRKGTARHSVSV
ncbi:oxygen-independent coproporphyrinogen III oxidase [Nitratireductor sp. XY-223]|uniref:oxygen-independent coproporphyrinogen III oxidase n=1 Tax=Nitratireductor sp. XY-223 TaxID=2561926 RepID=UPI0010AA70AD|nr:oxygen-independent coproporphyrinogen III oxidase [Nitratireductor sp. XY-223]